MLVSSLQLRLEASEKNVSDSVSIASIVSDAANAAAATALSAAEKA